jgi:4-diphosphocytidyl-2-C-methyl-D-erythritol kinase
MRINLRTPAKLNLFLHIIGRRADGYHQLQSLFRAINLYDEISVESNSSGEIKRPVGLAGLAEQDDLVVRAARTMKPFAVADAGAVIEVHKRIPVGAGMGGGSSNAAAVLVALNRLWNCQLPAEKLAEIALGLGADVAFFIDGFDQWAEGVGEKLTPVQLPKAHYVIVHPPVHCDTKVMFQNPALQRNCAPISFADYQHGVDTCNVFEAIAALQEPISQALQWLKSQAGNARLTGSGSAVFAEVPDHATARAIQQRCPAAWHAYFAASLVRDQHTVQR